MKPGKEERLQTAKKLKDIWKRRGEEEPEERKGGEEVEAGDQIREEDEEKIERELKEEEMIELGEYLGDKDNFCTDCAMMPCGCLLAYLDLKLQTLSRSLERGEDTLGRRRSSRERADAGGKDAGHQHQRLSETDAQHHREGQLHHP